MTIEEKLEKRIKEYEEVVKDQKEYIENLEQKVMDLETDCAEQEGKLWDVSHELQYTEELLRDARNRRDDAWRENKRLNALCNGLLMGFMYATQEHKLTAPDESWEMLVAQFEKQCTELLDQNTLLKAEVTDLRNEVKAAHLAVRLACEKMNVTLAFDEYAARDPFSCAFNKELGEMTEEEEQDLITRLARFCEDKAKEEIKKGGNN